LLRGRNPLQRRAHAVVELDHVHRRHLRRQLGGQGTLAATDLEHDVLGRRLRVADDRAQQVGVGEEVLAQPNHELPAEDARRVRLHSRLQRRIGDAADLGPLLRGGDPVGRLVRPAAAGWGDGNGASDRPSSPSGTSLAASWKLRFGW
jgi:hypothetical protein